MGGKTCCYKCGWPNGTQWPCPACAAEQKKSPFEMLFQSEYMCQPTPVTAEDIARHERDKEQMDERRRIRKLRDTTRPNL